jgi:pyruvate formate lyase activating enzyme
MPPTTMIHGRSSEAALAGRTFDIQRFSVHDGPGIRTTVFLQGCPLSCPWCHNPESRSSLPEVRVLEARCVRCGACLEACPTAVHPPGVPPGRPSSAPRPGPDCARCGLCVEACPSGARVLAGRETTVGEVVEIVERDLPFFEETGGGATFSGGEPLFQPEFLLACLDALRARSIHRAVDTTGWASRELILVVAARTDLFLYDLKVLDPDRHIGAMGVPLGPILENLRALDEAGAAVWIRYPVIPGWNDGREDLEALGVFAGGLRKIRRIHLLPYHRLAEEKYRSLGRPYPLDGLRTPPRERLEEMAERLRSRGLEVHVGG